MEDGDLMEDKTKKTVEEDTEHGRRAVVRGWIIVVGIAVAFVLYGLLAFFVIGDKQPADWNFGAVEDTPGESVYSTYPYRGGTEQPEPQHVNQKPPGAATEPSDQALSEPVAGKPEPPGSQREEESGQHSGRSVQQPGQPGTK